MFKFFGGLGFATQMSLIAIGCMVFFLAMFSFKIALAGHYVLALLPLVSLVLITFVVVANLKNIR